jgi:23S rRNA pseudouridine1911/1915/1917 synthase
VPIIDLPVLYEDDDCVVINKPIGLLTHSKGAFNPEATVASWLDRYTNHSPIPFENARNGIVHRLDRATSGVMIAAKTPEALAYLQKQFSQRKAKKQYIAIVTGQLTPVKAVIDMPIERNPRAPQTFRVGANGKPSVTAYEVTKTNENYSMVLLAPTTGRTHQLRVHLAHQGHPIVGDTLYKGEKAERLYLHAKSLEITTPSGNRMTFEAEVPTEFNEFIDK